jgi:hypothetical protein
MTIGWLLSWLMVKKLRNRLEVPVQYRLQSVIRGL